MFSICFDIADREGELLELMRPGTIVRIVDVKEGFIKTSPADGTTNPGARKAVQAR